jgi:hypothetical protein
MTAPSSTPPPVVPGVPRNARRHRLLVIGPVVLLAAAAMLRAVDAVPSWWRDEPRGARRYASVEALERETRTQLLLPFYFPEMLAWPPQRVQRAAGDGRPTSVVFAERSTGRDRLIVAQCLDGDCELPDRLLPGGVVRERTTLSIAGAPASLVRQVGPDGSSWTDLEWRQHGRRIRLRMFGDDAELLRIARSMRRGHP